MVNVEHGRLATFEQHKFVGFQGLVKLKSGIANHWAQALGETKQFPNHSLGFDGCAVVNLGEQVVLANQRCFNLLAKNAFVEQVLDADTNSVDFV